MQNVKHKKGQDVGSSSMQPGNLNACKDKFWKRIWSLPCPNKIKMFTWRVAHSSLALRTNLKRRGVILDDYKCLLCSRAEKDGAHLFVKCKAMKEVWRKSGMEETRVQLEQLDTAGKPWTPYGSCQSAAVF